MTALASLSELLGADVPMPEGSDLAVKALRFDSREVQPGDVFFARRGVHLDGRDFIDDAVAAGAVAVVYEAESSAEVRSLAGRRDQSLAGRRDQSLAGRRDQSLAGSRAVGIVVPDVATCLGRAADRYYRQPSHEMAVVGVTGTNGKTSVTHCVAQALEEMHSGVQPGDHRGEFRGGEFRGGEFLGGGRSGVIGTLGYGPLDHLEVAPLTTPDVLTTHSQLARMLAAGVRTALMEVSSHALDQGRVAGVRFASAALTNLSRDHLDYHADMDAYARSKSLLFEQEGLRYAVLNLDDSFGCRLLAQVPPSVRIIGYRVAQPGERRRSSMVRSRVEIVGRLKRATVDGIVVEVHTAWGVAEMCSALVGHFNAHNLLAALGILLSLDVPLDRACAGLERVRPIPGRMQRFGGSGHSPLVVVDYAHTPGALENALKALRDQSEGRLWCVFGCGGDRDPGKRAQMGAVASLLADSLVITDDNPRTEDGWQIIEDIRNGLSDVEPVCIERDRLAAVRYAVTHANEGDVVLVAGKGHESYQEIDGVRRPFSDATAVEQVLQEVVA